AGNCLNRAPLRLAVGTKCPGLAYDIFCTNSITSIDMWAKVAGVSILSNLAQGHSFTAASNQQRYMWLLDGSKGQKGLLDLDIFPLVAKRSHAPNAPQDLNSFLQSLLTFSGTRKGQAHLSKLVGEISDPQPKSETTSTQTVNVCSHTSKES